MLKEIFLFFKRERLYFLLLLFAGAFYALVFSGAVAKHPSGSPPLSKETQAFRDPAKKIDKKMSRLETQEAREGSVRDLFRKNPVRAFLFGALTICFILAVLMGAVMDVLFLMKPERRRKFASGAAPPQTRPWPFSILFKTVLLFIVWGILLSIVMGAVDALFPKSGAENLYMVLHTFILDVLCIFFMVRFLKQQGSHWRELGFQVPDGKVAREIKLGFLGYLGVLPVFIFVLIALFMIANLMAYEPPPHPLVNVFLEEEKRRPLLVVFSVLLGMVIGPIIEEIFFRGFCYPILKGKIGTFWAMAVSSAFFAGIHHSGFVFWPVFVLGFALAYLYETRKSLLSPVVLHITHNTVFICYFFLAKQAIGLT